MRKTIQKIILVSFLAFLGGCAVSRSTISPDVGDAARNPSDGIAVRLERVDDARRFESSPSTPDIPSLGGSDINDKSLTARAVGRKRGGFGMALGDVVLPEGQTVAQLMSDAITLGFRRAGYRVLAPGEAGYDQAYPVNARIDEFWTWFQPGFSQVTVKNRTSVLLTGPLPALKGGAAVKSEVSEGMMAVFEDDWKNIIQKGLADFIEKLRARLSQGPEQS